MVCVSIVANSNWIRYKHGSLLRFFSLVATVCVPMGLIWVTVKKGDGGWRQLFGVTEKFTYLQVDKTLLSSTRRNGIKKGTTYHLPDLDYIILRDGGNHQLVIGIPGEIGDG